MIDDVSAPSAYAVLRQDPNAALIDVRTEAEWHTVGVPDLQGLNKNTVRVTWQFFPSGAINPHFIAELRQAGVRPDQTLFFICRGGTRSRAAAQAAHQAGFTDSHNVAGGFEGAEGWRASKLP